MTNNTTATSGGQGANTRTGMMPVTDENKKLQKYGDALDVDVRGVGVGNSLHLRRGGGCI
jgi:hypothetical protein